MTEIETVGTFPKSKLSFEGTHGPLGINLTFYQNKMVTLVSECEIWKNNNPKYSMKEKRKNQKEGKKINGLRTILFIYLFDTNERKFIAKKITYEPLPNQWCKREEHSSHTRLKTTLICPNSACNTRFHGNANLTIRTNQYSGLKS